MRGMPRLSVTSAASALMLRSGAAISAGEEEHGNGEIRFIFNDVPEFFRGFDKKRVGDLRQDSGAIAGLHVGIDRTAVGHAADGGEREVEDLVAAFAMEVGDGAHAAVVVFLRETGGVIRGPAGCLSGKTRSSEIQKMRGPALPFGAGGGMIAGSQSMPSRKHA